MTDTREKYQKLASAIYLITGFFADPEPLKWRLRSLSADLVLESLRDKGACSREIVSLFTLAKTAGLVSEANHDILVREFSKIEEEAGRSLELMLPLEAEPKPSQFPVRMVEPMMAQAQAKAPGIKDNINESKDKITEERPSLLKEFGAVSVKKNSRQSTIIALLKRKKEIMIKDVSPLISGCSEKTIQRELSEMVTAGILKRIGEKRWTRYSLAHA